MARRVEALVAPASLARLKAVGAHPHERRPPLCDVTMTTSDTCHVWLRRDSAARP
jgi:hypothetical protein